MKKASGLPSGDSVPEPGSLLLIDRTQVLIDIADHFRQWKNSIDEIEGVSKKERVYVL